MKKAFLSGWLFLTITFLQAQVTANLPTPLELCDINNPGDEIEFFDLTLRDAEIVGAQIGLIVTYHETLLDAMSGTNPIIPPSNYANISNPQVVFARVTDPGNGDFDTTTLDLVVYPLPTPASPTPLEVCDDDNDGFAVFVLTDKDAEIINGELGVSVSYHSTLLDATNGVFPLMSPYININPFIETVWARVENNTLGCYTVVTLELQVNDTPEVNTVSDYILLDENGDGTEIFDLTIKIPEILGTQNPSDFVITFYESLTDAETGINFIVNPDAYSNISNPQTIYVRLENNTTACYSINQFDIFADPNLGVGDIISPKIILYPNPTSRLITLSGFIFTSEINLTLYSIQGKEILSENEIPKTADISLDISNLKTGVYFLKITSEGTSTVKKIVKN